MGRRQLVQISRRLTGGLHQGIKGDNDDDDDDDDYDDDDNDDEVKIPLRKAALQTSSLSCRPCKQRDELSTKLQKG